MERITLARLLIKPILLTKATPMLVTKVGYRLFTTRFRVNKP